MFGKNDANQNKSSKLIATFDIWNTRQKKKSEFEAFLLQYTYHLLIYINVN
jgi:hypothetical protein